MAEIHVFHERCVGAGNCVDVAPAYFDQSEVDGTVVALRETVAPQDEVDVEEAANVCPVAAIVLGSNA
jgi:ferredoxin